MSLFSLPVRRAPALLLALSLGCAAAPGRGEAAAAFRWVPLGCGSDVATCLLFARMDQMADEAYARGGGADWVMRWVAGAASDVASCPPPERPDSLDCRFDRFAGALAAWAERHGEDRAKAHVAALNGEIRRTLAAARGSAGAARAAAPADDPRMRRAVTRLQTVLVSFGYDVGGVDGVMGPRTLAATRHVVARVDVSGATLRYGTAAEIEDLADWLETMDLGEAD